MGLMSPPPHRSTQTCPDLPLHHMCWAWSSGPTRPKPWNRVAKSIDCGSRKQVLVTVVSVTLGRSHPHPGPQFPQLSQERLD